MSEELYEEDLHPEDEYVEEIEDDEEVIEGEEESYEDDSLEAADGNAKKTNDINDLSDEELDHIADISIAVLKDILKFFNVGEVTIDEYEGDEGELILDITGADLAVLIGRHGKTLDALQMVVSAITLRQIGFRFPVIVDVEGYKHRQRQKLEALARSAAKKAVSQHRSVKLRPMTPYERRIIHVALRDDSRVQTGSEGEGSARHVVVVPTA